MSSRPKNLRSWDHLPSARSPPPSVYSPTRIFEFCSRLRARANLIQRLRLFWQLSIRFLFYIYLAKKQKLYQISSIVKTTVAFMTRKLRSNQRIGSLRSLPFRCAPPRARSSKTSARVFKSWPPTATRILFARGGSSPICSPARSTTRRSHFRVFAKLSRRRRMRALASHREHRAVSLQEFDTSLGVLFSRVHYNQETTDYFDANTLKGINSDR